MLLTEQLVKFRKEHHYKQNEVAQYLQVSRAAYTNYENGIRLPDIYTLDKLARLYNVSIEAFLYPPQFYNKFKELHNLSYDHNRVPEIEMTENEKLIIYRFRKLSQRDQEELLHLAEYKGKH